MIPAQIADYSAKFNQAPTLIQAFRGTDVERVLEAVDFNLNSLEQAFFDVMLNIWLDTAVGVQLDVLGRHVGIARQGYDDESYRVLLRVQVALNQSAATPESLIAVMKAVYGATDVYYYPVFPAKCVLWQNGAAGLVTLYDFTLENGDLFVLDNGDTFENGEAIELSAATIEALLPSGVGITLADNMSLDNGDLLVLDNGDQLIALGGI